MHVSGGRCGQASEKRPFAPLRRARITGASIRVQKRKLPRDRRGYAVVAGLRRHDRIRDAREVEGVRLVQTAPARRGSGLTGRIAGP